MPLFRRRCNGCVGFGASSRSVSVRALCTMFVEVRFGDAGAKVPWNQLFNSQCTGASLLAFIRQACVRAAEQLARDTDAQLRREIGEATDKHMILQHKEAARDAEEDAPEGASVCACVRACVCRSTRCSRDVRC